MASIGLIEGIAEATTAVTKVFSGKLSDHLRRRKVLIVLGYGLAAISKPAFPLATSLGWVFVARFIDRVGKGIREAPRDALIAVAWDIHRYTASQSRLHNLAHDVRDKSSPRELWGVY